jgi:hypothetical protein
MKTAIIRVSSNFADGVNKLKGESGKSIIRITDELAQQFYKIKKRNNNEFEAVEFGFKI